jgi:hypothetical protein
MYLSPQYDQKEGNLAFYGLAVESCNVAGKMKNHAELL